MVAHHKSDNEGISLIDAVRRRPTPSRGLTWCARRHISRVDEVLDMRCGSFVARPLLVFLFSPAFSLSFSRYFFYFSVSAARQLRRAALIRGEAQRWRCHRQRSPGLLVLSADGGDVSVLLERHSLPVLISCHFFSLYDTSLAITADAIGRARGFFFIEFPFTQATRLI